MSQNRHFQRSPFPRCGQGLTPESAADYQRVAGGERAGRSLESNHGQGTQAGPAWRDEGKMDRKEVKMATLCKNMLRRLQRRNSCISTELRPQLLLARIKYEMC